MLNKEKTGKIIILVLTILAIGAVLLQSPIAQDQSYHLFNDTRTIFGILNFWNVISNLPFLFAGISGLWWIKSEHSNYLSELRGAYFTLFAGVTLVAIGSGYYHIMPSNSTLVWDRLPMTIAFMALLSVIVGEFISVRIGKLLLLPLLFCGALSVGYWHMSEINGGGDLRWYVLVQFVPVLIIPVILIFFNSAFTHSRGYWMLLSTYVVAKLLEHFDSEIHDALIVLSGHSLKHIVAAFGVLLLIWMYKKRVQI